MKRMIGAIALALATLGPAVLVTAPTALAQQAANLSGRWEGGYISTNGADVNTFAMTLQQDGNRLTGTVVEVNTFGDATDVLFLTSTIRGTVSGDRVTFTKTYDGSGGQTHSVAYTGRIEPTGRRVTGTFSVEGNSGRFEIVR
jgi:hypothetical protein